MFSSKFNVIFQNNFFTRDSQVIVSIRFTIKSCSLFLQLQNVRGSHLEVFCKKGALKNFAKFTGKHLFQSLFFFTKVADLRPATLFKKRLWHRCFPVNFEKFLRTLFFYTTPPGNCFWNIETFGDSTGIYLIYNVIDLFS